MIEQAKLLRVFTLIRRLKNRPGRTLPELAQHLDCSPRTIRRYLELLEEIGYLVDEGDQKRRFIFEPTPDQRPYFSPEEMALLHQSLAIVPDQNPLHQSLRRKLFLTSELVPLADELLEIHQARVVQELMEALRRGCRVRLLRYQSVHSNSIRDREVEPLSLTDNYAQLHAVDVASGQPRTYKVRRIESVELLATAVSNATVQEPLDVFGLAGPAWQLVELRLSARAYRLLLEEYPAARSFVLPGVAPDELRYQFRGEVRSYLGIGRFVLGLPSEVEVVAPVAFRAFLQEKVARAKW